MATYSNWREDLIEVIDTPTTEKKAEKKIKETKVNNKVVINPTFKESVAAMGGEILEVAEVDDKKGTEEDPQIKSKQKRAGMLKRQVLLKKLQAVRAGGGTDITAGYEPEGDQLDERLGGKGYKPYTSLTGKKVSGDWEDSDRGAGNKAKKRAGGKVEKKSPTYRAHVLNKEDYETKKTGEVLAAFKRDPKVRKRFEKAAKKEGGPGSAKNRAADDMLQTAKDTAKRKGDTSKSDDRYAYESLEVKEATVSIAKKANTAIKDVERKEKLERINKTIQAMRKHRDFHPLLHNPKGGATAADLRGEEVEVEEGYGKIKTPEKVVGKVRQPKKVAAPKGSKVKVDEGIMKMVKKVIRSQKPEKKAEKAQDAGARAKRQLARKVHAKYVSGSEDNVPDDIRDHYEVNERTLSSYIPSDRQGEAHRANLDYTKAQLKKKEDESTKNRGDLSKRDAGKMAKERLRTKKISSLGEGKGYQPEIEHSKLGDAKKKADKERESKLPPHLQGDAIGKMKKAFASEGEDKAFNFVVNKLKKKYGDGVLSKGDKIKPLTPEQKKKNAEIMAKRAKQDGRDATEKASDGRYSDRYSNRGSD